MYFKKLCRQMFEDYLNDCGLDPRCWDCVEAAELMACWIAAHDFDISRRFADWPVGIRTRIVCASTIFSVKQNAPIEKSEGDR